MKGLRPRLMRCPKCGRYTMKNSCPLCGAETVKAEPPRFSPLDKYGEYRRRLLYERS